MDGTSGFVQRIDCEGIWMAVHDPSNACSPLFTDNPFAVHPVLDRGLGSIDRYEGLRIQTRWIDGTWRGSVDDFYYMTRSSPTTQQMRYNTHDNKQFTRNLNLLILRTIKRNEPWMMEHYDTAMIERRDFHTIDVMDGFSTWRSFCFFFKGFDLAF